MCRDRAISPLSAVVKVVFPAMTPCGDSVNAHSCYFVDGDFDGWAWRQRT